MTSRETVESRIYMAEDAMYRRSDELDRRLHGLESRLKDLTGAVHVALCSGGSTPLELKTGTILQAVEAFEAGLDLSEIKALAERLTSLKGLIDSYEREIAQSSAMEILAAAGRDRPN